MIFSVIIFQLKNLLAFVIDFCALASALVITTFNLAAILSSFRITESSIFLSFSITRSATGCALNNFATRSAFMDICLRFDLTKILALVLPFEGAFFFDVMITTLLGTI